MSKAKQKQKITLEYTIRVSTALLYEYLTEPFRMQEWFADAVDSRDNGTIYVFQWKDTNEKQTAKVILREPGRAIRFQMDAMNGSYIEFRIATTELSKETILIIEDFVAEEELQTQEQLWDYQIKKLMHILGN